IRELPRSKAGVRASLFFSVSGRGAERLGLCLHAGQGGRCTMVAAQAVVQPVQTYRKGPPRPMLLPRYTDITHGLCQRPARISPKYFYDQQGSRLFEAI